MREAIERLEIRVQQLNEIIGDLRDNQSSLRRQNQILKNELRAVFGCH